jgi:hypothetical protein
VLSPRIARYNIGKSFHFRVPSVQSLAQPVLRISMSYVGLPNAATRISGLREAGDPRQFGFSSIFGAEEGT